MFDQKDPDSPYYTSRGGNPYLYNEPERGPLISSFSSERRSKIEKGSVGYWILFCVVFGFMALVVASGLKS